MVLIATTREGKKIVYAVGDEAEVTAAAAPTTIDHTVEVVDLKIVQALLQVSVKITAGSDVVQVSIPQNVVISRNSITFTLRYEGATKATPEVIAVGF